VRVEAASGLSQGGDNYFLGVDFAPRAIRLATFASGTLSTSTPSQSGTMSVLHTSTFHFALTAASSPGTWVRLTILNAAGQVVALLQALSGNTATLNLTLAAGAYTFRFNSFRTDGQPAGPVQFSLLGERLTDPVGPQPDDPTQDPSQPSPSSTTTGPSSSGSST